MTIRTDGARLWRRLMEMARIGSTPAGGVSRLALSDEDRAARELLRSWWEAAGLRTTVDELGNMFGLRPGLDSDAEPVLVGSHLDSQPTGGRFDGALGVFDVDYALELEDASGRTLAEELTRIGYRGARPVGGRGIRASLELHIEQGPILESASKTIGVVTGVQGARWYNVRIEGEATHAGPVPMSRRRDPVRGAARVLDRLYEAVRDYDDDARLAVGEIGTHPASRNTVPAHVDFTVDLRHPEDDALTVLDASLRSLVTRVTDEMALVGDVRQIWHSPTVRFAPECIGAVRAASGALGYSQMDVFSGAGHDSVYLQRICPAGMIFVPCAGGVSHAESESITPEDAEAGANVLLHATVQLAGGEP
jgi:N-carbamoyl-L-amino-acid hydrolase